jgi:dUTP pyrophosphatase
MCMSTFSFPRFLQLKMFVADDILKQTYIFAAEQHNNNMNTNPFPDAGFDLITPDLVNVPALGGQKINFGIKCSATLVENNISYPSGYYMYPRSSTGSKTPLRLANSVGIIDSGYRGNLMSVFDNIHTVDFIIQPLDKVVQLCAPGLVPIFVYIVNEETELSDTTVRGDGGFGSTTI